MRLKLLILGVFFMLLSACGPESRFTLYVAPDGLDRFPCTSPTAPCLTLAGAIGKAETMNERLLEAGGEPPTLRYTINVAAGTYSTAPLAGDYFAHVALPIEIFGAGRDATIFDAGNTYGGILVEGDVNIWFRDFTIQNVSGTGLDGCIRTQDSVRGLIENVTVQRCLGAGIVHVSELLADTPLELAEVISRENVANPDGLGGHGVSNAGAMQILFSTISHNEGVGVASSGYILVGETLVELNEGSGLILSGQANLDRANVRSNGLARCISDGRSSDPCGEGSAAGIRVIDAADVSIVSSPITRNLFGIYIDSSAATLRLTSSTVGANRLTGVYVKQGAFHSFESDIRSNATAFLDGEYSGIGGMYVELGAEAYLEETHLDGNQNGGIQNFGVLDVINSSISENLGDSRTFDNLGTASLANTLIANNEPGTAGGSPIAVFNADTMNLVNVSISQNLGTGLSNTGSLTMAYTTIAFNEVSGLAVGRNTLSGLAPSTFVENSIVLGHEVDCFIPITDWVPVSSGQNIETYGYCEFSNSHSDVSSVLEELADNGGFTMTNALVEGSPAIDAALGECIRNDQRGFPRPAGSACDVGAYEISILTDLSGTIPTSDVPFLILTQDSGCFYGPGLDWPRYSNLAAGTQAEIVGQGFGGGWMVVKHPTIADTNCWVDIDDVQFDFPLDQMRLISIPAKPTQGPTPTKEDRDPGEPTACPTNQNGIPTCP